MVTAVEVPLVIEPAPVALFAYNRLDHVRKTIESLRANSGASQTELHIFSDAAKTRAEEEKVENVRRYLRTVEGFKSISIVERSNNLGLARSVIGGVGDIFRHHDRLVVLEDDIVTSTDYLAFINAA